MDSDLINFGFILQICCFLYLLLHYLSRQLPKDESTSAASQQEKICIVICAHNEVENLKINLPKVLNQQNVNSTIIVVNDRSTDGSKELLERFLKKYSHLKVIEISDEQKQIPGKKFLLYEAIKAATAEKIIVTDADCFPASENWASELSAKLSAEKRIALGFSPFKEEQNFLNKFIRFEATQAAWLYLSMAAKGNAYMGVGRNMAFMKIDFLQWYSNSEHKIVGGDDDLFVNATATKSNVAVSLSAESFVFTCAKQTWSEFLAQKARHVQASFFYKKMDMLLLFFFALAQFLIVFLPFVSRVFQPYALCILALWLTLQSVLSFKAYKKFGQTDLIKWIPLLQLIFILYLVIVFLLSLLKGKRTWN